MSDNLKYLWSSFVSSKAYIYLIVVILLGGLVFFLAMTNQQRINGGVTLTSNSSIANQTLVKGFEEAGNLIKISDTPALANQLYFFGDTPDTKPLFISKSAKFVETGNVLQSKTLFVADTAYDLGKNNILINQGKESYKLDSGDGNSVLLANSIFGITPLNGKFFFIQNRDTDYAIKRSTTLDLADPETIITFSKSQIGDPDMVELRLFNDVPYLVTSAINQTGNRDIVVYRFGKTLEKKLEIANVFSVNYGYSKLLISSLDSAKIINTQLIDFVNPEKPQSTFIDFRQELGQIAKGKVIAQRCAIANGENKLLCMIKQEDATYFDNTKRDIFVEFDIDTQGTKIIYDGFNISASSVYYSPSNQVFIIGQENGLIYRVDDK
jgi:hypothetical protein